MLKVTRPLKPRAPDHGSKRETRGEATCSGLGLVASPGRAASTQRVTGGARECYRQQTAKHPRGWRGLGGGDGPAGGGKIGSRTNVCKSRCKSELRNDLIEQVRHHKRQFF